MALLGVLAADIDGQAGDAKQHDQHDGEDDQHLAPRSASHQLTTMVAVARWVNRPFESVLISAPMKGTMMSDR